MCNNKAMVMKTVFTIVTLTLSISLASQTTMQDMSWHCKRIDGPAGEFRIMGMKNPSSSTFDITSQSLDLVVDPATGYLTGKVTTGFLAREDLLNIQLDLSSNMVVRSIDWQGVPLAFSHGSDDTLRITMSDTIRKGQWASLEISYEGLPRTTGFGSYVVSTQHGIPVVSTLSEPYGARDWWPCKQDLADKFDTLNVWVTVPENYSVASNGILEQIVPKENDQVQFRWKHRYPIVTYLVAFAATQYEIFTDSVQLSTGYLPVQNFIYPGSSPAFKEERLSVLPVLQWCDTLLGPYPFHLEKYGHAQSPFGGGMEHQTISFMGSFNIELVAHELVHHYFGNMITCRSWQEIFINEGFASFLGGYYFTQIQDGFWWPKWLEVKRNQVFSLPDGSVFVRDTSDFRPIFNSRLTYAKGGLILNMLRYTMGDQAFFDALRSILRDESLRYGFGGVDDMVRHFSLAHGSDLTWYFDQWYYGEGHPRITVSAEYSAERIDLRVEQEPTHPSVPFFKGKLPIQLRFSDRDTTLQLWMDQKQQTYSFYVDEAYKIQQLSFDPDMDVLFEPVSVSLKASDAFAQRTLTQMYPNPVSGELLVDIHPKTEGKKILVLWNALGQNVLETTTESNFLRIPVHDLMPGSYWLELTRNGQREVHPLIISRP
jgi:aminopeptidase N